MAFGQYSAGFPAQNYQYPYQQQQSFPNFQYGSFQPPTMPQAQQAAVMQPQTQQATQNIAQQQQIQNGGFVSVRSMEEAQNYPVAPGNSVTFKDENAPYVYTKTMGFSQLERPAFEVYKLVKQDISQAHQEASESRGALLTKDGKEYALKVDIEALENRIDAINKIIEDIQQKRENARESYESGSLNQSCRNRERRKEGREEEPYE